MLPAVAKDGYSSRALRELRRPQQLLIPGPAGPLEAILVRHPSPRRTKVAVIAHPHPRFGGSLHSRVVYHIYRALHESGFSTVRFNFRGVGRSSGSFDHGEGEQDDLRAAIDFARKQIPGAPLWLAGYSFGSSMSLRVGCRDASVEAIIAVGTPVSLNDFSFLVDCPKPKYFVQGTRDEFGSVEEIRSLVLSLSESRELSLIEGADHSFAQHLDRLRESIVGLVQAQ